MYLELSFELGALDSEAAERAAFGCGAFAVTFADARDQTSSSALEALPGFAPTAADHGVLEPAPGEVRLWPATRMKCLFAPEPEQDLAALRRALGAALGMDAAGIGTQWIAERIWEREWLADFHAQRFGQRLWVCPHHERVTAAGAVVVALDPGLAFGTGRHASTALCLEWLDLHVQRSPAPACLIDYGCGSGVLALAAVKLGAHEAHCFDLDPQALIATRANALTNGIAAQVRVHDHRGGLPGGADVLLANILAGPLCALAPDFASLVRPGGELVLAGLLLHEVAEVTAAYAAWFDVARFGDREGWVCLAGRRH
jgi:ribosomal protein L11 methyltransferase